MSKKDTSAKVPQREKIKTELKFNEIQWTENQKKFIEAALNKETKILICSAPAGVGKTLLAVYCALKLLAEKRVSDIIYTRSAVESSDSRLGFLPGSEKDKMEVYGFPFYDKLHELLPKSQVDHLIKEERVSVFAPNFARGMSWNVKCILFDECQNSTRKEIITTMTRLGKFSKAFLLGDPDQTDLPPHKSGFNEIFNLFDDEESKAAGIHTFKFDENDIMRSELVKYIVSKLKRETSK